MPLTTDPKITSKIESKISVIVPVYNSEKYLRRCVESILNQTHKNIEVILVNDGSIDSSSKICDFYAKNDKIITKHIENSGTGGARNVGLKFATGDYISFVDSDDWIHPETLSTMLLTSIDHNVDLVECDLISTKDQTKYSNIANKGAVRIESKIESLKRILDTQRFSVVVRLYKKELVTNILFREKIMAEDVYFTLEIINKVDKLAIIPYSFYFYFVNIESVTKKPYNLKYLETVDAAIFVKKAIVENDLYSELNQVTRKFILEVLLFNYMGLHNNIALDPLKKHLKQIKKLIKENYTVKGASLRLSLASFLPINLFSLSIKFNSLIKNRQQ